MSSKTKKESKKISSSVSVVDNEQLVTPSAVVKTSDMVDTIEPVVEKKKRGRKKQNVVLEVGEVVVEEIVKPPPKKRGRKPKGGKIIQQTVIIDDKINNEANVILHLKCSLNDINNHDITTNYPNKYTYNPSVENIQSFHFDSQSNTSNFLIDEMNNNINNINNINNGLDTSTMAMASMIDTSHSLNDVDKSYDICNIETSIADTNHLNKHDNTTKNEIWEKLNMLKVNLHNNNIYDKRSACFWCTHDFDNPPIFIPKNEFKDSYQVYGCFCSPECSVAHLMNEKIDSSIKFERYQLLNHIYGKIYNYSKNIKPAPDPQNLLLIHTTF
jgi:hypothetical protein